MIMHASLLGNSVTKIVAITLGAIATLIVVDCQWRGDNRSSNQAYEYDYSDCHSLDEKGVIKRQIALDVIEGRLSLVDAAAKYGELNRQHPIAIPLDHGDDHPTPLRSPVRTDEERLCRQVINWVGALLSEDPDRAKIVVARLELEYRTEQDKESGVRLPDPATVQWRRDRPDMGKD
jgi:hypothetical protein